MIEIKDLHKNFWQWNVISNVSFSVDAGDVVCFVWWSGVWKTTLLHTLIGLEKNYEWAISIDWKSLADYLQIKNISYVGQTYTNFPWLTAKENILLWCDEQLEKAKIKRILQHLDIESLVEKYPHQLSWGQQQRVSIARAILQDTDIIALDEPFSALDQQTKTQLHQLLLELVHEENKTVLLVTHDIEEAVFLSDKVIVLWWKPGKIIDQMPIKLGKERHTTIVYQDIFQYYKRQITFLIKSSTIIDSSTTKHKGEHQKSYELWLYLWSGNAPFFYAVNSWLFEEKWFSLTLQSHLTHKKVEEDLLNHNVSLAHMTLDRAKLFCAEHQEYTILKTLSLSMWWDGLVAKNKIISLNDLKGKCVWVEKDSVSEFFLNHVLEQEWIEQSDIDIVYLDWLQIVNSLINHQLDAGMLREPRLSKILEYPEYKELVSSKDYPILYDVLVCHSSFVEEHKDFVDALHTTRHDSYQRITSDIWALKEVSSYMNIPYRELAMTMEKIDFVDIRGS